MIEVNPVRVMDQAVTRHPGLLFGRQPVQDAGQQAGENSGNEEPVAESPVTPFGHVGGGGPHGPVDDEVRECPS